MIEHIPRAFGIFRLRLYDEKSGRLTYDTGPVHNLAVNVGKIYTLQQIYGQDQPLANMAYLAIGTDTTAANVAQTQLNPVVTGQTYFQTFDPGITISTATPPVCSYQITIPTSSGNFTIGEFGTFNGPINGTAIMLNRALVSPTVTKSSSNTAVLQVSFTQN